MPQWRKLHTKILQSDDLLEMPDDFTRLVWTYLPLILDREGRCPDNISLVKSRVMPMREDVTPERIGLALDWFAGRGMIVRYRLQGRPYLSIPGFSREYLPGPYRSDYATAKWRKAVFERDDYTCQDCGERGGRLNAHHIRPWYADEAGRFDVENGVTLCKKCHHTAHSKGWKGAGR